MRHRTGEGICNPGTFRRISYWADVREGGPYLVFVSIVFILAGFLCLIFLFRLNIIFLGKLLFCAISCINVHSVCFHSGGSGKECVLVMCYL